MEQNINALLREIGDLRGKTQITVSTSTLRALAEAAKLGETARWGRPETPEFVPSNEVYDALLVKLAAMAARREIPALRSHQWEEREVARKMLARQLTDYLLTGFIVARPYQAPFSHG